MKNLSRSTEKKNADSFAMKRAVFLGIVIVLVAAVVVLSLYSALSSAFGGADDSGTVSSTEDGKLVIEDLYAGEITIPKFDIAKNTYDTEKFKNDNGLVTYDDPNALLGIDVSDYQGEIDWQTVKESGIEFAVIRAGYRGATRGSLYEDERFEANYEGATNAGIKVGVYFFSQATSVAEAEEEAGYVLNLLQNKKPDYPVFFDWEIADVEGSRSASATGEQVTSFASAFCKKISKAGFKAGVYFNRHLGYDYYNLETIKDFDFWLAEYQSVPAFYYDFKVWQYSDNAQVQGISTPVDINISFKNMRKKRRCSEFSQNSGVFLLSAGPEIRLFDACRVWHAADERGVREAVFRLSRTSRTPPYRHGRPAEK